jgi:hypothetical protein
MAVAAVLRLHRNILPVVAAAALPGHCPSRRAMVKRRQVNKRLEKMNTRIRFRWKRRRGTVTLSVLVHSLHRLQQQHYNLTSMSSSSKSDPVMVHSFPVDPLVA